jgi:putative ABC transport system substrate-binding protein
MRIVRAALAALLGIAVFVAPLVAEAQQAATVYRIGILLPLPLPVSRNPGLGEFLPGLRDLDYVEGRNIIIEYRAAEGKLERLPTLAADLVSTKVDIIFALATTAAQAAKNATKMIPIVFAGANDPVNIGLVASLARPGGNVTGLTNTGPDLSGKRLELLKEIAPGASRIAILWNPANPTVAGQVRETEVAARALGTQLQVVEIRGPDDLESAFQAITSGRAGGLVVIADVITHEHRERIAALAARSRLPTISECRAFAASGVLMSYGPSIPDAARRAAVLVDKILKGAKPADLPVEQPTKFELVINMKTAKALGLTIPPSLLLRADQVIE